MARKPFSARRMIHNGNGFWHDSEQEFDWHRMGKRQRTAALHDAIARSQTFVTPPGFGAAALCRFAPQIEVTDGFNRTRKREQDCRATEQKAHLQSA